MLFDISTTKRCYVLSYLSDIVTVFHKFQSVMFETAMFVHGLKNNVWILLKR